MLKKIIPGLALLFFSCKNADKSKDPVQGPVTTNNTKNFPIEELVVYNDMEEGWGADVRLSIISEMVTDSAIIYTAVSKYNGKPLGLSISIPSSREGDKGFAKGIVFKSIGPESDHFLSTLSTLYKQKADSTIEFTPSISAAYVNLAEFAKSLGAEDGGQYETANEYKLFFEGTGEEDYAELYLNINPKAHWIELREKDEEYRPLIIKFMKKIKRTWE